MGMTLKELLTKGEGTLSAQEAKTLAAQCRMDVETLYTLLEERGIKIIEDEADADVNLDVDSIIAEVENAENNSDELGLGGDDEEEAVPDQQQVDELEPGGYGRHLFLVHRCMSYYPDLHLQLSELPVPGDAIRNKFRSGPYLRMVFPDVP